MPNVTGLVLSTRSKRAPHGGLVPGSGVERSRPTLRLTGVFRGSAPVSILSSSVPSPLISHGSGGSSKPMPHCTSSAVLGSFTVRCASSMSCAQPEGISCQYHWLSVLTSWPGSIVPSMWYLIS